MIGGALNAGKHRKIHKKRGRSFKNRKSPQGAGDALLLQGGTAEDLRTATDELIALVYEQAEKLDELQS